MSGKGIDLELLRGIFTDDRLHIGLALVQRVTVKDDMTKVILECKIVPEGRTVYVTETWESVGDKTVSGDIPDVEDLILIVMADGDADRAYSIRRLASHDEKLPQQIKDGHFVTKSKPGKKLYLASDAKINITTGKVDGTEPLVLGIVLTAMLTSLIAKIKEITSAISSGPVGIGNLGAPVPTFPALISALAAVDTELTTLQTTFLTSPATNILSQIAFTERKTT